MPGCEEATPELIDSVLEQAARLAESELAPLNRSGDEEGCAYENGVVRTPRGFQAAYATFRAGGWTGVAAAPEWGGQGLPKLVNLALDEMFSSANFSFATYPGLSQGAYDALARHADQRLQGDLPAQARRRLLVGHHVPDRAAMRHRPRPDPHQGRAGGRRQLPRRPAPRSSSAPASTT